MSGTKTAPTNLTFFTNDELGMSLYDRVKRTLTDIKCFDILVGYFRISGPHRLYDAPEEMSQTRILVGLNDGALVEEDVVGELYRKDHMHELLDQILEAPSPERAREAVGEACLELEGRADKALEVLESGWEEATAILAVPAKYRRRLRTTNMLERFIGEIRRREKVVRIFPNEEAAYRLIGALCAERHEE